MSPTNIVLLIIISVTAVHVRTASAVPAAPTSPDCHGHVCNAIDEYCSNFIEGCDKCEKICNANSHNYNPATCTKECSVYQKYDPLQAEIHTIHTQQNIILILLVVLMALFAIQYAYKCYRWLRLNGCFTRMLKKLVPKRTHPPSGMAHINGKDIAGATTISNVMAINDMERAPSQIYSVTGAEGSVLTMTTPVSTRYPAEDSTTPTTIPTEYSYDNQALAVTPVSEKPSGNQAF